MVFPMILEMVLHLLHLVQMLVIVVVMKDTFYICAVQHCYPDM
jgi:hypothetical protein